jgi:hypothetical protein
VLLFFISMCLCVLFWENRTWTFWYVCREMHVKPLLMRTRFISTGWTFIVSST